MMKAIGLGLWAGLCALPRALVEALMPPFGVFLLVLGVGVAFQGLALLTGSVPVTIVVMDFLAAWLMVVVGTVMAAAGVMVCYYGAQIWIKAIRFAGAKKEEI